VASTSNLGGAIETYSSDPSKAFGLDVRQTIGDYQTTRTFGRLDSGTFGDGNSGYVSFLHQDARAWDFRGHQRGNQANLKFVHDRGAGRVPFSAQYQDKSAPTEGAPGSGNQQPAPPIFSPSPRPSLYPNLPAGLAYLNAAGAPPAALGNNFSNYFSA